MPVTIRRLRELALGADPVGLVSSSAPPMGRRVVDAVLQRENAALKALFVTQLAALAVLLYRQRG
jgi:hypothetical protein